MVASIELTAQPKDDPALLEEMVSDLRSAEPVFQTTRYWAHYERVFLPYLYKYGLQNFRSGTYEQGGETFWAFGATDAFPEQRKARGIVNRLIGKRGAAPDLSETAEAGRASSRALTYKYVEEYGRQRGAVPLSRSSVSLVGGPVDCWQVDNRWITTSLLYYYMRYAYVAGLMPWTGNEVVVELGSGSGKQAELLARLYPEATLLLFDIPPQLYVAHQYLTEVFGDRVVQYREAKSVIQPSSIQKGKIYLFPNWRLELISNLEADIFWSTATFGEMEPSVALNYLSHVRKSSKAAYLMQVMQGRGRSYIPARRGVIEPTTLKHYKFGLSGFECLDIQPALAPTSMAIPKYEDSFWKRT